LVKLPFSHNEGKIGNREVAPLFVNLVCFGSEKRATGTHRIRVWVGRNTGRYVLVKLQSTDALFSSDIFVFRNF